jgi:hypothetical protein
MRAVSDGGTCCRAAHRCSSDGRPGSRISFTNPRTVAEPDDHPRCRVAYRRFSDGCTPFANRHTGTEPDSDSRSPDSPTRVVGRHRIGGLDRCR